MSILKGLDEEKAVQRIVGLWEDWKEARREKERVWTECLQGYLVYIDEAKFQTWPWRSKVADTFSQETADTIASSQRNMLFPTNEEFFELIGTDLLGRRHQAQMKDYLEGYLQKMKWIERLTPHFKQLCVLGNSPVLLPWTTQTFPRRFRQRMTNPVTGEVAIQTKDEATKTYDGPGLQVLDLFDVVGNPSAVCWSDTPFIRRTMLATDQVKATYPKLDLSELEEGKGKPSEVSDLLKVSRAKLFGLRDPQLEPGQGGAPTPREETDEEDIEVLEVYGELVIDGERHPDIYGVVLNRHLLARFDRNPYWGGRPLIMDTYDPLWFTAYGKGPLEPVRGVQELIDTFSNQKVDEINQILIGSFKYVDDGVIDPETLYLKPGGGIEVGNMQNLEPLHRPNTVALAYAEINSLRERGERSTGASAMDMGQVEGGRKTAYEVAQVQAGGTGRSLDVVKHLANEGMETILEFYVECLKQYKWQSGEIPDECLLGQYRVKFLGAQITATRQYDIQQLMQALGAIGQIPQLAMALKPPGLLKRIWELFHVPRPDEISMNEQEYQQEVAKQQALAAQQAQQPGPQGTPGQMGPEMPDELAALMGQR